MEISGIIVVSVDPRQRGADHIAVVHAPMPVVFTSMLDIDGETTAQDPSTQPVLLCCPDANITQTP